MATTREASGQPLSAEVQRYLQALAASKQHGGAWRRNWHNLHDGATPKVEVRLALAGDDRPSTRTCTWPGDDVTAPDVELKRPGHGRVPFVDADWKPSLDTYRPFLSYSDRERSSVASPASCTTRPPPFSDSAS